MSRGQSAAFASKELFVANGKVTEELQPPG